MTECDTHTHTHTHTHTKREREKERETHTHTLTKKRFFCHGKTASVREGICNDNGSKYLMIMDQST